MHRLDLALSKDGYVGVEFSHNIVFKFLQINQDIKLYIWKHPTYNFIYLATFHEPQYSL
jgi:hypothetical protein